MKKLILLLIIVSLLPMSGCIIFQHNKYEERKKSVGWEFVRIERSVPCKDCKYIIQESCGGRDSSRCYDKFKKDAKKYGANTVVLTEDIRSWKEGSSMATGTWSGNEVSNALADFYDCPKYEIKQSAPSDARRSTNKSDILLRVEQPKQ